MFNLQLLEIHLIISLYNLLIIVYFHLRVARFNTTKFSDTFIHTFKIEFHFVVLQILRKHCTVNFRGIKP